MTTIFNNLETDNRALTDKIALHQPTLDNLLTRAETAEGTAKSLQQRLQQKELQQQQQLQQNELQQQQLQQELVQLQKSVEMLQTKNHTQRETFKKLRKADQEQLSKMESMHVAAMGELLKGMETFQVVSAALIEAVDKNGGSSSLNTLFSVIEDLSDDIVDPKLKTCLRDISDGSLLPETLTQWLKSSMMVVERLQTNGGNIHIHTAGSVLINQILLNMKKRNG